jgi:hypothetical protein
MVRRGARGRVPGAAEAAARAIFDMLLDHARAPGQPGPALRSGLKPGGGQPGLDTGDFALFGDGLGAVMKDVLGREASPALLWAWSDTYWGLVRPWLRQRLATAA